MNDRLPAFTQYGSAPDTGALQAQRNKVLRNTYWLLALSLIPTVLISRTEVVTGGASAAYGSDAVAGVVNLIIDDHIQGLRGSVQGGFSNHGDNTEFMAAA